jgi:hypothetical protein
LLFSDEVEMISKSIETIIGEEKSTLLREEVSGSENPLPMSDCSTCGEDLEVGEFFFCFIWGVHPLHDFFDVVFLLVLPLSIRGLKYDGILHRDDESDDESEEEGDLQAGGEVHGLYFIDYIPRKLHRTDEVGCEFFPEVGDMDIDGIEGIFTRIILSPDCLVEEVSIEDHSPMFDEDGEEFIFFRREFDLVRGFLHRFRAEID